MSSPDVCCCRKIRDPPADTASIEHHEMIGMAKKKFTDRQVKAYVLYKLKRKGCWSGKYKPVDSVVSWTESVIKRNGKRIRSLIEELVKDRYIKSMKGGDTISLNRKGKGKINRYLEKHLKNDFR